jgi:hypothetical protein
MFLYENRTTKTAEIVLGRGTEGNKEDGMSESNKDTL